MLNERIAAMKASAEALCGVENACDISHAETSARCGECGHNWELERSADGTCNELSESGNDQRCGCKCLLPCPFCGPGQSRVDLWFDDTANRYRVGCGRCGCSTGISPRDKTEAPAIAAWNTRASHECVFPASTEQAGERVDVKANVEWLKTNAQSYLGQWVAIKNGVFIDADKSSKKLRQRIGPTKGTHILVTWAGGEHEHDWYNDGEVLRCYDCTATESAAPAPPVAQPEADSVDELLPCPWCLGPAQITSVIGGDEGDGYVWHVLCSEDSDCTMMPDLYTHSEQEAIRRWNTRASTTTPTTAAVEADVASLIRQADQQSQASGFAIVHQDRHDRYHLTEEFIAHLTSELSHYLPAQQPEVEYVAKRAGEFAEKCYVEQSRQQAEIERLKGEIERLTKHVKSQDVRIVNQRSEIKNRIAAEESAQRTLAAYREALGGYDGLRRIQKLKDGAATARAGAIGEAIDVVRATGIDHSAVNRALTFKQEVIAALEQLKGEGS